MEKEFYVYIHTRNDTGLPFYVGKGKKKRAWSKHSRGRRWKFIVGKHGFSVNIVKDGMSERCALTMEMIVIRQLRASGYDLVNVTDGGDGVRGLRSSLRKPVVCSNGMEFESVNEAAKWARVTASKISSVCKGHRLTSAGLTWWFKGDEAREYVDPLDRVRAAKSKGICCSNGMTFSSGKAAVDWLKSIGISADRGNISYAASGKIRTAYGFAWWFLGDDSKEFIPRQAYMEKIIGEPIVRDDGLRFDSSQGASRYMSKNGYPKADGWPIRQCCKGRQSLAYGHKWRFANDGD